MAIRRAFAGAAGMLALAVAGAAPAYGQDKPQEEMRLKKPEMAQYQTLTAMVDTVVAGKEPAPADLKLTFRHHFVKSGANVYVPYVLEISSGKLSSFPVAMYVRAVQRGGTASTPNSAFTDIYFLTSATRLRSTGADGAELSRGLELPPGEFDLYIAMAETPPRNSRVVGPGKRVVHTQPLIVPDFSSGLTTSSIILAKSLDDAPQPLTAQQQLEEPFTIGGYRITPAFTSTFPKSGELLFVFFIYNAGAGPGGKPDVEVGYYVFRAAEAKPFSRAPTTTLNATTLPAEFSSSAGHHLVVGQGIPLTSFTAGDYKLEIRITDKTNSQTITRNVPFTVAP